MESRGFPPKIHTLYMWQKKMFWQTQKSIDMGMMGIGNRNLRSVKGKVSFSWAIRLGNNEASCKGYNVYIHDLINQDDSGIG